MSSAVLPKKAPGPQPYPSQPNFRNLSNRLSFTNQLPTTYEAVVDPNQPPLLNTMPAAYAPQRADNPFTQWSEVDIWKSVADQRRTSVATDQVYSGYFAPNPADPHGGSLKVYNGHYINVNPPPQHLPVPPLDRVPAPRARRVRSHGDLNPKFHPQPKFRRCSVNSAHISPANAMLVYLSESYHLCQPLKFQYSKMTNPRRVLTKPLEPCHNHGLDNEKSDYILYVNDVLGAQEGRRYMVLDLLGSGTFGQVVKCQNLANQLVCAVKIIKLKPAYLNQLLTEVRILQYLKANSDGQYFIRLEDTFMHKEHLCLVFELLTSNLYELIKQNQFHGLSIKLVKLLTRQLLQLLAQLKDFQMIHCDLKPENILLVQPDKADIKVIDFGLACFARQTVYTYIQLRFYRLPEVILGLPYTEQIDMWLLGCIVGELFLGLPLFPGTSEYNQIFKIVEMLGPPPRHMLEVGRNSAQYFKKNGPDGQYVLKLYQEYCIELETCGQGANAAREQPNKDYFEHRNLRDIIFNYKMPSRKMARAATDREISDRTELIDFLTRVLDPNPLARLTPQEALKHAFVAL